MATNREILAPVQDAIDDALRTYVITFREIGVTDDEGNDSQIPDNSILGDWSMIMQWIDPSDGSSNYFRLGSKNISAHVRIGLNAMLREWNDD